MMHPLFKTVVTMIVSVPFLLACNSQAENGDVAEEEKAEAAIPVEASAVEQRRVFAAWYGSSTLEAERESSIVAKTNGVLLELHVEEGDVVTEGQVVATLESDRQKLEAERAKANYERLKNEMKRSRELFAKNLTSSETHERIQFDLDAAKAAYELAELTYRYTKVRAPIGGVISERFVKEGNLIADNMPLFTVTDFDPIQAVLHVPEQQMALLQSGQPVELSLDALPDTVFAGEVARISPVVDAQTGTFKVTAEFEDPNQRLRPGMFARVALIYDVHENALTVPREALVQEDGASYVYVVEGDAVKRVLIQPGYETAGYVEVLEGVSTGAAVVTTGKAAIGDGSKIEVINNSESVVADANEAPTS